MGNLSKHFDRKEFECKCGCGFDVTDFELVNVLEDVRVHFRASVSINSPNRCLVHNEYVQKIYNPNYIPFSSKSPHMKAKAADIVVKGVPANDVAKYLEGKYPDKYGIGRYKNRTHIDVRANKARWEY